MYSRVFLIPHLGVLISVFGLTTFFPHLLSFKKKAYVMGAESLDFVGGRTYTLYEKGAMAQTSLSSFSNFYYLHLFLYPCRTTHRTVSDPDFSKFNLFSQPTSKASPSFTYLLSLPGREDTGRSPLLVSKNPTSINTTLNRVCKFPPLKVQDGPSSGPAYKVRLAALQYESRTATLSLSFCTLGFHIYISCFFGIKNQN